MLSAEELLAGTGLTYEVEIPRALLHAGDRGSGAETDNGDGPEQGASPDEQGPGPGTVRLRPLSVRDLQVIARAAKEKDHLMATLMVQRALEEPEMTIAQVASLPVGLVQFLLDRVNEISGITADGQQLEATAEEPLVKAAFVLSRELGWTPEEIHELTLGQVLLHLRMLGKDAGA